MKGTDIRKLREGAGMRSVEVILALGVDESLYAKWERGIRPMPEAKVQEAAEFIRQTIAERARRVEAILG